MNTKDETPAEAQWPRRQFKKGRDQRCGGRRRSQPDRFSQNRRAARKRCTKSSSAVAGLPGLTAARDLSRSGCKSFLLLEARNRVGSRTCNSDLGGGRVSDGGGAWRGHGQTATADLARELKSILSTPMGGH